MELRQTVTRALHALALPALALAVALAPASARAGAERFAVVVGNDAGEGGEVQLRYAESDAARLAAVLQEVGGVRPENLVLLRGQDAGTVRRTLIAVNDRVRAAGGQAVLIVYYSGHADAAALHLGRTQLELAELELLVRGSAASFRLLVLDACRSGALTRVKGGTPTAPFGVDGPQLSERVAGEGAVFLTSSAASEDSQESDELQGGFFTHALVSGLLGAADVNDDGRVTLDEAYRYAYEATLRASSRTLAGTQHPTFQYEVRGQGDLVLSTPGADQPSRARLELPAGRAWLLFSGSQEGAVVGEVGLRDRARRLSLRPGRYFARGRGPDALLEGSLALQAGEARILDEQTLRRTDYARLVRRGAGEVDRALSVEVGPRARTSLASDRGLCAGASLGVAVALRAFTLTPRLGYCRSGFQGTGLTAFVDAWDLELSMAHVWDLPSFSVELGLTLGGGLLRQRFSTSGVAPARTGGALQLAPGVSITRELTPRSYLSLGGHATTYLLRTQEAGASALWGPSFALRLSLAAGLRL